MDRGGKSGDKGLGKRPFRKNTAKEVGKFKGDKKDIAVQIRPQYLGGDQVPEEPQDAGKKDTGGVGKKTSNQHGEL